MNRIKLAKLNMSQVNNPSHGCMCVVGDFNFLMHEDG